MQVIIFKNDEGGVSVIHPTQEALDEQGIDAIALKDVPAGKPFKIIDSSDLPSRESRNLWDVDESDLDGGVGAEYGNGSDWMVVRIKPLIIRHRISKEVRMQLEDGSWADLKAEEEVSDDTN